MPKMHKKSGQNPDWVVPDCIFIRFYLLLEVLLGKGCLCIGSLVGSFLP